MAHRSAGETNMKAIARMGRRIDAHRLAAAQLASARVPRARAQHVQHAGGLVRQRVQTAFTLFAPYEPQAGEERVYRIGADGIGGKGRVR